MGGIAELRRRAQRSTSNLYDTLFTRRVSIYLTALLYPLAVSANIVSAVNILVAFTACLLIGFGSGGCLIAGVLLMHLFAVLDSVDGELARLRQTFSLQGLFLEDLAAFTMINGMFLAVGGYVSRTLHVAWPIALAVIVVAFGRNAMQVARRALLKSIATRRPISPDLAKEPGGGKSGLVLFVEKSLLNYTNVWVVLTSAILVEVIGGYGGIVVVPFAAYAILVLFKELAVVATYTATRRLDRELVGIYRNASSVPTDPVDGKDLAGD